MVAVIGALRVALDLGVAGWKKGTEQAEKDAAKLQASFEKVGTGIAAAGGAISASVTAPFIAFLTEAIPAAVDGNKAMAQVEAGIKSMGNAAKLSADQLEEAAGSLAMESLFDDDEILSKLTANLLTFGNISEDVFLRTQQAAVDMSARMNGDLQGAAIMLGKALNDPVAGLTRLTDVGVSFTAQQTAQVKAMVAAGNTAGAQGVILKELERQFKGSAKAASDAEPYEKIRDLFEGIKGSVGEIALKYLPMFTSKIEALLGVFDQLSPEMQEMVVIGTAIVAALGPVLVVVGAAVAGFGQLVGAAGGVGAALTAAGLGIAPILGLVAGLAAAAYLVYDNWDKLKPIFVGLAASFKSEVLPALGELKTAAIALWEGPVGDGIRMLIKALGEALVAYVKFVGPAAIQVLKSFVAGITSAFGAINDIVKLFGAVWNGEWSKAGELIISLGKNLSGVINGIFGGLPEYVAGKVRAMYEAVRTWLVDRLGAVWDSVKKRIDDVKGFFFGLYDAVVGHSYIPDMVNGIEAQMARLDKVLVAPAVAATASAAEAFKALASEVHPLLDRLFPEARALRQYQTDKATIDQGEKAGMITAEQAAEARRRLAHEGQSDPGNGIEEVGSIEINVPPIEEGLKKTIEAMDPLKNKSLETTAKIAQGFADMATNVVGSLRGMVDAFKSGDILGGIQGILDIVTQVATLVGSLSGGGAPGGGGFLGLGGARAFGGPTVPGKAYRVGERGPEWFVPTERGRVLANGSGVGGNTYNFQGNLLTPDFWAEIQRRDETAAMQGSMGGAQLAVDRLQRRSGRRL